MKRILPLVLALSVSASAIAAPAKPLKIFILAGQSNMEGHAGVETFDYIGDDPATAPLLQQMRGADGKPRVCDHVWISYLTGNEKVNGEGFGKLTAGYGSRRNPTQNDGMIGPEFTFGLTMAAEVRALAGEYESALEALEEALTVNPQERVFRPFTFVTRAELLLAHGEGAAAEADYREAIAVAEAMGAKAWEWRATAALARLLVDRGAAAAGRELVAPLLADAQAGEITTLAAELGWS